MDYLFSPWRYRYLAERGEPGGCVLCAQLASGDDDASLVVHRGALAAVMLNRYPYTSGHVMILPYAHAATLAACGAAARSEMIELAAQAEAILTAEYRAQGLNLGMNLGEAAGAGIAGHLHLHVVPRWSGDANFMTVVGETRVLPEELSATYARLRRAFALSLPRP
ncbi:MAG TPA: HIT domain-containing protein [Terriglobales bacterium]|nr:HIT domain-containing protein [Terriglobales bacterium]